MKQIVHINNIELGKILASGTEHYCEMTVNLTKNLDGRWVDATIYLNDEQMKELHRIIVRNNINKRGFLETHELVKNYHGCNFDAWVEKKRK